MAEPEKVIVLEDNEEQNEDIIVNTKRPIETSSNQNNLVKKQRSIPNIANELARNRAEVRLPAISTNKIGNASPQERPRLHAIPLASLLSPSVDYNYSSTSSTPPVPAPFTSTILKSEMQPTLPALLDKQNLRVHQSNNSANASSVESVEVKSSSSGKSLSAAAKQGNAATPAKKATTRRRKNDGSSVSGSKKAAGEGGKGSGKKTSSKTPKKEDSVQNLDHQSPSASPTSALNSGRKVILPSQDGNSAPRSNSTPPQASEETEEQNILIARISSPVNPNQKGLKRTQSNLNPASKGTAQDSQKAKKTLSASNIIGAATPTPLPVPASSAAPISSKKSSNAGTCKRDAKGKAKQSASKKKDSSATPAPVTEANPPPTSAPQALKKLVPPQPIKSPSLIDVFDQKSQGASQDEDDVPIIVLDVPLYQVGRNDYLDENGQVVFNFYNLVQEKFGTESNPRSRNANRGASKGENSEDVDMVEDEEDDEEEAEEDEEGGVATSSGMSPPKWTKKKVNPLKGKSRVGKYDIDDPFIDDSELLWEEQRAATKDGFFVYFGPLIQKGQYATFERVDGTMKKGGVRNPR